MFGPSHATFFLNVFYRVISFFFHSRSRSWVFPEMIASDFLSRNVELAFFFILFPFPNFGNGFFPFPSRSQILGMVFFPFPSLSQTLGMELIIHSRSLIPKSHSRSPLTKPTNLMILVKLVMVLRFNNRYNQVQ